MRFAVPSVASRYSFLRLPPGVGGAIRELARQMALPLFLLITLSAGRSYAQASTDPFLPTPTPSPQPRTFFFFRLPQRTVAQAIPPQEGPNISARLMDRATPENTNIIVSLGKQRVYLMCDNEIVIDSPISSGRKGHPTPAGNFRIREKALAHFSNIYGNFVDRTGRVVRSGVSAVIDSAPSGTHFEGAPMRFFMRLSDEGVGMHVGILPGYPASHGCVRMPPEIAPLFYAKVRVGTPVQVQE